MKAWITLFCCISLLLACGSKSSSEDLTPTPDVILSVAETKPATPSVNSLPLDAVEVTFPSGDLLLHGFIYKPAGTGPFPAVLYNHGSEKLPGTKASVAEVFVKAGYVFFVPHRRGQGRSPGPYIQDELLEARRLGGALASQRAFIELHEGPQLSDQLAGLHYLQGLSYVDKARIVTAGCSYGGIQVLLAAERNVGFKAAVDFAGAAQSWAQIPNLPDRLLTAVQGITIPTFLLQAENDFDLTPTKTLGPEFERLHKPYLAKIYPPFGVTNDDGHAGFCFNGGSVWGSDVLAFLSFALR